MSQSCVFVLVLLVMVMAMVMVREGAILVS